MALGFASAAKPGRAGRGYQPRVKSSKPQKTTESKPRIGVSSPGKAGVGGPAAGKFGNKPSFKQPPAAPKKPATSKPVVGQKPEFDQTYYDQVDLADQKATQGLSALDQQEGAIKRDYGIEDATDPFSRVNGLKRMFLARQKAASASLASQGQLYSGAHERALSRTRLEEEAARSELRKSYEAAINQIGADKAGVKFASEEDRQQAFEDWLARAPEADVPINEEDVNAQAAAEDQGLTVPGAPAKGLTGAQRDALALAGPPKGSAPGPIVVGGGPQASSPAESRIAAQRRAKAAKAFQDKVTAQRAKNAEKRQQQAQEFQQRANAQQGGNKPKVSAKPKPKAKAAPKKGRR